MYPSDADRPAEALYESRRRLEPVLMNVKKPASSPWDAEGSQSIERKSGGTGASHRGSKQARDQNASMVSSSWWSKRREGRGTRPRTKVVEPGMEDDGFLSYLPADALREV